MGIAFVTGGSGYVGRNLIRALVARNQSVRALARSESAAAAVKALGADLQAVCKVAHPQSLQLAMVVTSASYALAGLCFLASCRWLRRDMVAAA